jgi:hypothetical protein
MHVPRLASALVMAMAGMLTLSDAQATPLLVRAPLPPHFEFPEGLPPPPMMSRQSKGAFICFIEDIDGDGKVTIVATLYQRGFSGLDVPPKTWPDESGNSRGARVNGKPVIVRVIASFLYDRVAEDVLDRKCSWAAYDVWHAAHPDL